MRERGYEAYVIEGGLHEWRERGYPVEEREARHGWLDAILSALWRD
jgi:3-mercaptopyruvate sulfurtransferase SseA